MTVAEIALLLNIKVTLVSTDKKSNIGFQINSMQFVKSHRKGPSN